MASRPGLLDKKIALWIAKLEKRQRKNPVVTRGQTRRTRGEPLSLRRESAPGGPGSHFSARLIANNPKGEETQAYLTSLIE